MQHDRYRDQDRNDPGQQVALRKSVVTVGTGRQAAHAAVPYIDHGQVPQPIGVFCFPEGVFRIKDDHDQRKDGKAEHDQHLDTGNGDHFRGFPFHEDTEVPPEYFREIVEDLPG